MIHNNDESQEVLDMTSCGYSNEEISNFLQSNFEENREILREKIEEMRRFKANIEKTNKERKFREQKTQSENLLCKEKNMKLKVRNVEIREKLTQLKLNLGVELMFNVEVEKCEDKEKGMYVIYISMD